MRLFKIGSNKEIRNLYEDPNQNSPKLYRPSQFVEQDPTKKSKVKNTTKEAGFEYDHDITNDNEYCKRVFESHPYQEYFKPSAKNVGLIPTTPNTAGTQSDINDPINRHTYPAFSSTLTNGTTSDRLTYTLGKYACDKLGKSLYESVTQEEFFVIKLRWMLKMARIHRRNLKNNYNDLRNIIEKIIEESAPALEGHLFADEGAMGKTLRRLGRFLSEIEPQKAILLTYKLFKMHLKQINLEDPENRKDVANKFHNVFTPYIRFMEIKETKLRNKMYLKKTHLVTYIKIRNLMLRNDIAEILAENPDPRFSQEFGNRFRDFLREKISLENALQDLVNKCREVMPPCNQVCAELQKPSSQPETRESLGDLDEVDLRDYHENATSMDLDEKPAINSCNRGSYCYQTNMATPNFGRPPRSFPKLSEGSLLYESGSEAGQNTDRECELMNDPDLYEKGETTLSRDVSLSDKDNRSFNSLEGSPNRKDKAELEDVISGLNNPPLQAQAKGIVLPQNRSQFAKETILPRHEVIERIDGENWNLRHDPTRVTYKPDIVKVNSFTNLPPTNKEPTRLAQSIYKPEGLPIQQAVNNTTTSQALSTSIPESQPVEQNALIPNVLSLQQTVPVQQTAPLTQQPVSVQQTNLHSCSTTTKEPTLQRRHSVTSTAKEMMFQKVLNLAYDTTQKWEKLVENAVVKIDKIKPEDSPVILLRAWSTIEGFTPEEVFKQIYDTKTRSKWDTVTMDLQVVEEFDSTSEITYFYIKTPFGITERDFVQKRHHAKDYPEKGQILMSFQSSTHPSKPPVKNRIRGDTHFGGYLLKPSPTKPNSTDLCILSQVDIKGKIPKSVVNMFAGKAPADWINRLKKACDNARR